MAKLPFMIASIAAVLIAASVSMPAHSEDSKNAGGFVMDEIIITATKREEKLQDVPISVSAFDGDFLDNTGVTSLTELEQYTPSLSIKTGSQSRATAIRIRGIGSQGSNSGIDPSVGVFIDGVYQGRAGMSLVDLVDIDRVEVLRGPQGTLYGKNTAAGAISIVTNKPSTEKEGELELTYANDDRKEIRGTFNTPLGDSGHAIRATGYLVKGDALHTNTFTGEKVNDVNKWGAKTRLLFDMDSAGELLMTLDYSEEDTNCCALAVIDYDGLSPLNVPFTNTPSAALQNELGTNSSGDPVLLYTAFEDTEGFSPPDPDPFSDERWFDGEYFNKVNVGGIAGEWNIDLPNKDTLTVIGAWRNYTSNSAFDGDFTAYDVTQTRTDVELDQYSLELRIASPGDRQFDYVGGLYAYDSKFDSLGTFSQKQPLVENIFIAPNFPLSVLFPDGSVNTDTNQYKTRSYAAFGQLVWNASEKFKPALGLRYTYEEKQRVGSQITTPTLDLDLAPVAGPDLFFDSERSDSAISPSLNLRYFLNKDIMTYASVSRGFKSGGFNQRREEVGSDGEFGEETATNFELGIKGGWLNGALFYVDYDDFQTQIFDGSSIRVTNAGALESYGGEFEMMFPLKENLILGTALGYNKATYTDFKTAQCTVEASFFDYYVTEGNDRGSPGVNANCTTDLTGESLDNAPEWTVSSFLHFNKDLSQTLNLSALLHYSYTDGFFLDQTLDSRLKNKPVNLVNLNVTLANEKKGWEAALWGRNILDENYYAAGFVIPAASGYAGVVAPDMTYGATLRVRY